MKACVLAAVDPGPSSGRVLRHAAGFARLVSLPLRVLHVNPEAKPGRVCAGARMTPRRSSRTR